MFIYDGRTKFANDSWMIARDFMKVPEKPYVGTNAWWWQLPISELQPQSPVTIPVTAKLEDALAMKNHDGYLCVVDGDKLVGLLNTRDVLPRMLRKSVSNKSPLKEIMNAQYRTVTTDCQLGKLALILDMYHVVALIDRMLTSVFHLYFQLFLFKFYCLFFKP